jgi:type IV secretion system protein VirD4
MYIIQILFKLLGILVRIALFLGLHWWLILVFTSAFISDLIMDIFHIEMFSEHIIFRNISNFMDFMFFYGGFIPALFITPRNIIRLITRNPEFSFFKLLFKPRTKRKERKFIMGSTKPLESKTSSIEDISGFFFGKRGHKYITISEDKDGHILVVGGPGTGKSSCIAIPTIITWHERIFAIDIKGELSQKSGRLCQIFNPSDPNTLGYDPFYNLNNNNNRVADAKEIALSLIPIPHDIKDPFWKESAQNLLTACILHFSSENYNFIDTMAAIQSQPIEQLIEDIYQNTKDRDARLFINQFIGLDIKTLSGIYTELANKIMVFATDPQLKVALSKKNNIQPSDLENGLDVFLSINEEKLEQWKGLLNLIVQQFLKHFERRPDGEATPILFLLDEFARLGKIDAIANGLATLRSKKIHICLITQSLAQLDDIYGQSKRKVIVDCCSYKAILNATDADTQEYFSRLIGTFEKEKVTNSASYEHFTKIGRGTGISRSTEDKRIIKPEDFAYLDDIVLITPHGHMRVDKVYYFKEPLFTKFLEVTNKYK